MNETQNNWDQYSKLVLKELETLSKGIFNLSEEIQDIKREIALIKDREDKVEKLQEWKEKVSEVISPTQLAQVVKDVKDLTEFKANAVTFFIIIQGLMALVVGLLNYFK